MDAVQGAKRAAISAVVTRADGTVEDLGIISFYAEDADEQARIKGAIDRGERVDERDVFTVGSGTISFSGNAMREVM